MFLKAYYLHTVSYYDSLCFEGNLRATLVTTLVGKCGKDREVLE